jgi:hypothetical protein
MIPKNLLQGCKSMFSLELPGNIAGINDGAFFNCPCLRNVAFPPNAVIGIDIFGGGSATEQYDLYQLFGSLAEIMRALQHRFDGLPIHKLVYYQSYHQEMLHMLIAAINLRSGQRRTLRSKLDPTGNQQDCLGMTPLHILACSSVHDIELYCVLIENYPTNLITEDRWGALPLLYAFWGAAPAEIIQFLLDSYQSIYPDYVFNWTRIVQTMGRCDTPKERIENLLHVKQMHFPEQPIDWDYLLDEFAKPSDICFKSLFQERMQYLVMCGISTRVDALPFKVWCESIFNTICAADFKWGEQNFRVIRRIQARVAHFEDELHRLKEITTILELALWKMRINQTNNQENATRPRKKGKADKSSDRQHSRVTCGADAVIRHVLPYLLISAVNEESDLESDNDDDDDEMRAV